MDCKINRNNDGKIEEVFAGNGKPSLLYQSLLKTNQEAEALNKYLLALTLDPKLVKFYETDSNGEPTVKTLTRFIENDMNSFYSDYLDEFQLDYTVKDGKKEAKKVYTGEYVNVDLYIRKMRNNIARLSRRSVSIRKELEDIVDKNSKEYFEKSSVLSKIESLKGLFIYDIRKIEENLENNLGRVDDVSLTAYVQFKEIETLINRAKNSQGLELEEIEIISDMLSFWDEAGNFKSEDNPFLSDEQKKDKDLKDLFQSLKRKSDDLHQEISELIIKTFTDKINKGQYVKKLVTEDDVKEALEEVNELEASLRNNVTYESLLPQLAASITDRMHDEANRNIKARLKKLSELTNGIDMQSDEFMQQYDDGSYSGNLVNRYKAEFYSMVNKLDDSQERLDFIENRRKVLENAHVFRVDLLAKLLEIRLIIESYEKDGETDSKLYKSYVKKNKALQEEYDKSYAIFEEELGSEFMKEVVESFEKDYWHHYDSTLMEVQAAMNEINALKISKAEKAKRLKSHRWNIQKRMAYLAPHSFTDTLFSKAKKDVIKLPSTFRLIIPKDPKMKDSKFEKLMADPKKKQIFEFLQDVNRDASGTLPFSKRYDNFLPIVTDEILKSMIGGSHINKDILKTFKNIAKSVRYSETDLERDKLGLKLPRVQANRMEPNEKQMDELIYRKERKYIIEGKEVPNRDQLEKEVRNDLAEVQSADLLGIFSYYIAHIELFKSRAKYEPIIRMNHQIMLDRKKKVRDNLNMLVSVKDENGNDKFLEAGIATRTITATQENTLKDFYGLNMKEEFWETSKKIYTDEEKNKLNELRGLYAKVLENNEIPEDEKQKYMEEIDKEMENLGNPVTGSGILNQALFYNQLRGMGWNIFSAGSTMFYGRIANNVEAGRLYDLKHLEAGNRIVDAGYTGFFGKTAYSAETVKDSQKAAALQEMEDMIDSPKDIQERMGLKPKMNKTLEKIQPLYFQESAEYFSQMPVIIAILKQEKVTVQTDEGEKTISWWDGFDSNWNWKYGKTPESWSSVKGYAKNIAREIHGNYGNTSSIRFKNKTIGNAILQYRTWMISAVANRFGKERDFAYGDMKIKGRYRSYVNLYNRIAKGSKDGDAGPGAILRSLAAQLAVSYISSMVPFLKSSKINVLGAEEGAVDLTKFTKDDVFSEIDAKNITSNMHEIAVLLALMTIYYTVSSLAGGGDDEDKKNAVSAVTNFMLNQLLRAERDITMWGNPESFQEAIGSSIPVTSLLTGVMKYGDIFKDGIFEGEWTVKSGIYAGDNRLFRNTANLIPGLSQLQRFYDTMDRVVESNRK